MEQYAEAWRLAGATAPAGAMKPVKPDCATALASVEVSVAATCDCATAATHAHFRMRL